MLRQKLLSNILLLRQTLSENGLEYYGDPSAIVCVKMGSEAMSRLVARRLPGLGLLSNLVEYPAVAKGAARFRMQVMAGHSEKNIRDAVKAMRNAVEEAKVELEIISEDQPLRVAAAA